MQNILVFRLYGPMAAWGEIAVGEVRRSATYPGRSAILGLISAAIGIMREENDTLSSLYTGYDVAVKVQGVGTLLKDYHTVQVPDSTGKQTYATRRDEIVQGKERLGTILTSREYHCDALCIVALRARPGAPYSIDELRKKLIRPEFVLYLGRKSCPIAAPVHPQIIDAAGFRDALDRATFPPLVTSYTGEDDTERFIRMSTTRYYWENDAGDMEPQQSCERYDEPLNRSRWQFAPRTEHMMVAGGEK
jgi:CRISPR system Cascade subunit CasD